MREKAEELPHWFAFGTDVSWRGGQPGQNRRLALVGRQGAPAARNCVYAEKLFHQSRPHRVCVKNRLQLMPRA